MIKLTDRHWSDLQDANGNASRVSQLLKQVISDASIAEAIALWRSHSHPTEKLAAVLFTKFTNCRTTAAGSLRRDVSNKGAFN